MGGQKAAESGIVTESFALFFSLVSSFYLISSHFSSDSFAVQLVEQLAGAADVDHGGGGGDVAVGQDQHDVRVVGEGVDEGGEVLVPDLDAVELGAHPTEIGQVKNQQHQGKRRDYLKKGTKKIIIVKNNNQSKILTI